MTYNKPMYTFIELPVFTRFVADYFTDEELADLQKTLTKNPKQGDVVQGTQGVRLCAGLDLERENAVVCGFCIMYRITVYAKSARENIATSTLNTLREIVDHAEII